MTFFVPHVPHAEYAECAEIFLGTRIGRMARIFCLTRNARKFFGEHESGEWHEFFGLRFLWLLWNVWLMRRVWMCGLDSDFDAGEEAARKGGTVDVA